MESSRRPSDLPERTFSQSSSFGAGSPKSNNYNNNSNNNSNTNKESRPDTPSFFGDSFAHPKDAHPEASPLETWIRVKAYGIDTDICFHLATSEGQLEVLSLVSQMLMNLRSRLGSAVAWDHKRQRRRKKPQLHGHMPQAEGLDGMLQQLTQMRVAALHSGGGGSGRVPPPAGLKHSGSFSARLSGPHGGGGRSELLGSLLESVASHQPVGNIPGNTQFSGQLPPIGARQQLQQEQQHQQQQQQQQQQQKQPQQQQHDQQQPRLTSVRSSKNVPRAEREERFSTRQISCASLPSRIPSMVQEDVMLQVDDGDAEFSDFEDDEIAHSGASHSGTSSNALGDSKWSSVNGGESGAKLQPRWRQQRSEVPVNQQVEGEEGPVEIVCGIRCPVPPSRSPNMDSLLS
mmetsp:Transcript_38932/g.70699  ORF Transcript_38932/g.70699 Transcript_38932/m.70699 type:complete len:402 (+) Transcript_38932:38-1243(+)